LLQYKTFLGKFAGWIGPLRGPDLARWPDFGYRWLKLTSQVVFTKVRFSTTRNLFQSCSCPKK